jgi:hypothetical protein
MNYVAPWWLPGGNLQTIWPALWSRRVFGPHPVYRRERWDTPDGDFIDVDFLESSAGGAAAGTARATPGGAGVPLLVLFHGLEGSSRSHYSEAFADFAHEKGMKFAVAHFRGCSGELNRGPRAYHSGDHEEIDWILAPAPRAPCRPAAGCRRLPGRQCPDALGRRAGATAAATCAPWPAVCSPLDLAAGGCHRARFQPAGLHAHVPRTMKPKALQQAGPAPRPVRPGALAGRRVTCMSSTTCSPRRCTVSRAQRTTGRAPRPSRTCGSHPHPRAGAQCPQRPVCAGLEPASGP